jgi:formate dehydrogenase subunit gamma
MPDGLLSSPWSAARASEIIGEGAGAAGALLPLLHALHAEFGCVPEAAVPMLASALNLSRAEVHGVLTFYRDFRRAPVHGHVVRLCRAEACQARGGREVEQALKAALIDAGVTLEAVYCLGLCASGPAALVNGNPVARLQGVRLARLIEELRK